MQRRNNVWLLNFAVKLIFWLQRLELIQKAYVDAAVSRTTIFERHKRLQEGMESVKDDKRNSQPTTSRADNNIAAVAKMVLEDRIVTSQLIADTLCIPKTMVLWILSKDLQIWKLCARFVPHALMREQMDERIASCQDLLNMFNSEDNFLNKIITDDESWCFGYDPEMKCQSSEWVGECSPRPKKLRFQKSRVKTMLIVFFDSQGVVHKEFVEEGCTMNAEYYKGVLNRLILRI
jgi:hypothetical protein